MQTRKNSRIITIFLRNYSLNFPVNYLYLFRIASWMNLF
jgi:hypothetical protein